MTEAGVLCGNADVIKKSGVNANSTATAEAWTNVAIPMAEGFISAQARYDYVTNYSSISTIGKAFLKDLCSSLTALKVIGFDMSAIGITEAQTLLDMNYTIVTEGINLLRDDKFREFVRTGVVS